jgi:hypothetical protein
MRRLVTFLVIPALLATAVAPAQAFVIGGFDAARGGILSVEFGSLTGNFRAHVAATFPGTTYLSTGTLTDEFLSSIDVLVISAVKGDTTPITLLSAAEQTALVNFVIAGGSALILTDNDFQFEPASDSLVSPFGLDADGAIVGATSATVTASHPVTAGPFGTLTTIDYAVYPGWYPTLGPNAIALARLVPNNQVSLAVINRGTLAPGSGAVVFFADATIDDGNYTGSTVALVDNALAYAASLSPPAPTANAGADQSIHAGQLVTLDGSGSFDDDTPSGELVYAWTLTGKPDGSLATLSGADSLSPTFVADVPGEYVVSLRVTDSDGLSSAPDTVAVSSLNAAPVADAAADQGTFVGENVTLDGSASHDPDLDALAFSWSLAPPGGSAAVLAGETTAFPTFVPDVAGSYTATLTVTDPFGGVATDSVVVSVITAEQFAETHVMNALNEVRALSPDEVTKPGNRRALQKLLTRVIAALRVGDLDEARLKLMQAIERTDGCALQGSPDGSGPGRDWITTCEAQARVYPELTAALDALTP